MVFQHHIHMLNIKTYLLWCQRWYLLWVPEWHCAIWHTCRSFSRWILRVTALIIQIYFKNCTCTFLHRFWKPFTTDATSDWQLHAHPRHKISPEILIGLLSVISDVCVPSWLHQFKAGICILYGSKTVSYLSYKVLVCFALHEITPNIGFQEIYSL